jgi:hypothetical protein
MYTQHIKEEENPFKIIKEMKRDTNMACEKRSHKKFFINLNMCERLNDTPEACAT